MNRIVFLIYSAGGMRGESNKKKKLNDLKLQLNQHEEQESNGDLLPESEVVWFGFLLTPAMR